MPRVGPADAMLAQAADTVTRETVIEVGELLSALEPSTSDESTSAASAASTRGFLHGAHGMRLRALARATNMR
jgi:hypothetical protein